MFHNQKFLIVLDLDGTLLTSEKTISPKTKEVLLRLSREGHVVTMASGRPPRAILPFYRMLGLSAPMVGYNGSIILLPDEEKVLFERRFSLPKVKAFLERFPSDLFLNVEAEYGNEMFFLRPQEKYEDYFHREGMNCHYGEMKDLLSEDLNAFLIEVKDPADRPAMSKFVERYDDVGLRFWYDSDHVGEFYFYDVNKATAIRELEKIYGVDRAHVICFGDADNDVEMIGTAGISFAMKNGSDELKKVADYVTPEDNDHDGIALALEGMLGL